jgi:hypothetical protein
MPSAPFGTANALKLSITLQCFDIFFDGAGRDAKLR